MKQSKMEREIGRTKKIYESMETPKALDDVVRGALKQETWEQRDMRRRVSETGTQGKRRGKAAVPGKKSPHGKIGLAAAALAVCFITALNTNEAFAATAGRLPVIGAVSRVLTFRNYDTADEEKEIHMEIPQIQEPEAGSTSSPLAADVNKEIETIMEAYRRDAQQRIEEYKEAFLATGGTEEAFAEKGIKVDAGYEVKYETEDVLSLEITANENWASAYGIQYFYNLDLKNGKKLTLGDLLGQDYKEKVNSSIRRQMEERMAADRNLVYWDGSNGMDGFKTVGENTKFYIGANGNPVIVFDKYEIAPGAFGIQEFEINRQE